MKRRNNGTLMLYAIFCVWKLTQSQKKKINSPEASYSNSVTNTFQYKFEQEELYLNFNRGYAWLGNMSFSHQNEGLFQWMLSA